MRRPWTTDDVRAQAEGARLRRRIPRQSELVRRFIWPCGTCVFPSVPHDHQNRPLVNELRLSRRTSQFPTNRWACFAIRTKCRRGLSRHMTTKRQLFTRRRIPGGGLAFTNRAERRPRILSGHENRRWQDLEQLRGWKAVSDAVFDTGQQIAPASLVRRRQHQQSIAAHPGGGEACREARHRSQ